MSAKICWAKWAAVAGLLACGAHAAAQVYAQPEPAEATASAKTALDEAIAMEASFRAWYESQPRGEATRRAQGEVERRLADLKIESLSPEAIEVLAPMLQFSDPLMGRVLPYLSEVGTRNDADGAAASVLTTMFELVLSQEFPPADRVRALLEHPGMETALRAGRGVSVIRLAVNLGVDDLEGVREPLVGLRGVFDVDAVPVDLALSGPAYLASMRALAGRPDSDIDVDAVEASVIAAARRSLAQLPADADEGSLARLELMLASLDGAFARGRLLNHEAPDMQFTWASAEELPETLSALRGRVVVLDFWATWCQPCVASFPKIRELTAHYEGKPVTVLGVTHLQGQHVGGPRDRTNTAGKPELEYELMDAYIGERDITWPVVFVREAVWIEYGVEAIPHIAIVDKEGTVRHRGLNPFAPLEGKYRLIDALLAEEPGASG